MFNCFKNGCTNIVCFACIHGNFLIKMYSIIVSLATEEQNVPVHT